MSTTYYQNKTNFFGIKSEILIKYRSKVKNPPPPNLKNAPLLPPLCQMTKLNVQSNRAYNGGIFEGSKSPQN